MNGRTMRPNHLLWRQTTRGKRRRDALFGDRALLQQGLSGVDELRFAMKVKYRRGEATYELGSDRHDRDALDNRKDAKPRVDSAVTLLLLKYSRAQPRWHVSPVHRKRITLSRWVVHVQPRADVAGACLVRFCPVSCSQREGRTK